MKLLKTYNKGAKINSGYHFLYIPKNDRAY